MTKIKTVNMVACDHCGKEHQTTDNTYLGVRGALYIGGRNSTVSDSQELMIFCIEGNCLAKFVSYNRFTSNPVLRNIREKNDLFGGFGGRFTNPS